MSKSLSQKRVTDGILEKLDICGLREGKKFEFPSPNSLNHNTLAHRELRSIESNVGFAIYSLRLNFTDGATPKFGTDQLTTERKLDKDERITKISLKATQIRIVAIIFKTNKGKKIELLGSNMNGAWHKFYVEPEQRVVGCTGYLSHSNNIVGLGFILWSPRDLL